MTTDAQEETAAQDAEAALEGAQETDDDTEVSEDAQEPQNGNQEAAKYRRRLRAAEAARDELAERLAVVQRSEAERIAAATLADPVDLWRDGANVEGVLDADGNVDTSKVGELADALVEAHPHWSAPRTPVPNPRALQSGSGRNDHGRRDWSMVLKRGAER